ncbi:MAG: replicative DNA helicase [Actinobacteria bacterium]|nr:replicative DNA helicase [Actinomycetota bacterium]
MRAADRPQQLTNFDKVPPHNIEAEQSLLGAMLISHDAIPEILEILGADAFYTEAHKRIYETVIELYARGDPVDPITLSEALSARGYLEICGGKPYIHTLVSSVPSAANVKYYAKIVERNATLRALIKVSTEIASLGYEAPEDVEGLIDRAESLIFSIAHKRMSERFIPIKDLLKEGFEAVEQLFEKKEQITGVPTGFADMDQLLAGFHPGDLIIIAARPAMGKTALALNMATSIGLNDVPVAIFSLEMNRHQLAQRMMCSEARIDSHRLRTGHLRDEDWSRLSGAVGRLAEAPIFIDDTPSIGILEVRAKARRLFARHMPGVIIVDYLQLMQSYRRVENRQQEIAEISRGLKILAKELEVPVIALSQLSRAVEHRSDKRPQLSDLRECVTGDTLVVLSDGQRIPIRLVVGTQSEVLAVSPNGRIVPAWSDKVWSVGKRPVFAVRLASGRAIRATGQHRLLGATGWRRVEDLSRGDRIALARSIPEPINTIEWPDAQVALLGHLIGDGSYLSGQPMRYTTASEENSKLVAEAAREKFGAIVTRYAGRGNWHQLLISGNGNRWSPAGVNAWLRELGIFNQRSYEKRIPDEAFRLSNRQVGLLLRHLWATDGTISPRSEGSRGSAGVFFSTSSEGLANDVAFLLLRLGIVARIRHAQQGTSRPWYNVNISGAEDQRRFLKVVGAFGPRCEGAERLSQQLLHLTSNTNVDTLPREVFGQIKQLMAASGISHRAMAAMRGTSYGGSAHFSFAPSRAVVEEYAEVLDNDLLREQATSDLFWDTVIEITPDGEEEVFDLTVPGPSCWLADGVVSHNSGAIEQDADIVMFIHRNIYGSPDDIDAIEERGTAEVIVAKHRNGPIGVIGLAFLEHYTRFADLARSN